MSEEFLLLFRTQIKSDAGICVTGKHLSPDEFHEAVEKHLGSKDSTAVFIDCRNFYESKIVSKFLGSSRYKLCYLKSFAVSLSQVSECLVS